MNTVITPVVDEDTLVGYDMNEELGDCVVQSLIRNNSFVPNINNVIFNTKIDEDVVKKDENGNPIKDDNGRVIKEKKALENPVLVTVVYFVDGTKVTVRNSEKDGIKLVEKTITLSDGSTKTVMTASEESKEIGLVYAIVKRVICNYDEQGTIENAGFARFLNKIINNAHVQDVENAKILAERKISNLRNKEAKKEAKKSNPSTKKEKASLRGTVNELMSVVKGLGEIVAKLTNTEKEQTTDRA
jgi:hypothetical protein